MALQVPITCTSFSGGYYLYGVPQNYIDPIAFIHIDGDLKVFECGPDRIQAIVKLQDEVLRKHQSVRNTDFSPKMHKFGKSKKCLQDPSDFSDQGGVWDVLAVLPSCLRP
jgi:hypothetical protein